MLASIHYAGFRKVGPDMPDELVTEAVVEFLSRKHRFRARCTRGDASRVRQRVFHIPKAEVPVEDLHNTLFHPNGPSMPRVPGMDFGANGEGFAAFPMILALI